MATINIKGNFEGYLWESDKQAPQIYKGESLLSGKAFNNEENPFIIEGQLFDRSTGHSVSIKYADGKYLVNECYIKTSNDGKPYFVTKDDETEQEAIPCVVKDCHYRGNSKLKGNNLLFYELWEEKPDPLCCNMKVLEATKVIFAGFE